MAYFAQVKDGVVQTVIVADQDFINTLPDAKDWIETDADAANGVGLRANYAGIGYVYDKAADVFYPPQPYPSWVMNKKVWQWEAPVPMPDTGLIYEWEEKSGSWIPAKYQWNELPVILTERNIKGGGVVYFLPPSFKNTKVDSWLWKQKGDADGIPFENFDNKLTVTGLTSPEEIVIGCVCGKETIWSKNNVKITPLEE